MMAILLAKVTIVLAVALVATRLAQRSSAAFRHVLLAVAFAVLLALPVASVLVPAIPIEVPAAVRQRVPAQFFEEMPSSVLPPDAPVGASDLVGVETEIRPVPSPRIAMSTVLLAVWALLSAVSLLPIGAGLWQVHALRSSGVPWPGGQSILDTLTAEAGIRRRIEVLLNEAVSGPMTCGVVRPAVLLPTNARSWTEEDLRRAMIHELEHVRRFDWVTHCFARAMCAAYWFHPLVWIAKRRLILEAERACDDAVLRRSESTAYADQLVCLAERMSTTSKQPLLAMANPGDLTMRVRAILDAQQRRTRAGMFRLAAVMSTAAVFVIAVSSLRMVTIARETAVSQPQAEPASQLEFEVASLRGEPPALPPQASQNRTRPADTPKWEVVSIRPCDQQVSGGGGRGGGPEGGAGGEGPIRFSADRMTMRCQTTMQLVQSAYLEYANSVDVATRPGGLFKDSVIARYAVITTPIEGRPDLMTSLSERYTIEAKAEKTEDRGVMRGPMLQALLEDRFKLKLHFESREIPLFALTVTKGGSKLKPHQEGSCTHSPVPGSGDQLGPPSSFCKFSGGLRGPTAKNVAIEAEGVTVTEFIKTFLGVVNVGKPIVDKTGIAGKFDFNVVYALPPQMRRNFAEQTGRLESDLDSGPLLIDAIEEQLGLKLEEAKGPWPHLIIDQVERPSPN